METKDGRDSRFPLLVKNETGVGFGAELDISLGKLFRSWRHHRKLDTLAKENLRLEQSATGIMPASGILDLNVFQNATLRKYQITRITMWGISAAGVQFNPGNPVQSATGWFGIYGGNNQTGVVKDFWPQNVTAPTASTVVLPVRLQYGEANALRFSAEEDFQVYLSGLAAISGATIVVGISGFFSANADISGDDIVDYAR